MKSCLSSIFSLLLASYLFAQPQIELETFAVNLDKPVNIKHAGDARLFVIEQDGLIQIVNPDGSLNSTPFLDIQGRVINVTGIGDERGLLGLAFHPQYTNNGFFYVNYINNSGDTTVSRFSASSTNSDVADPNSELILLTIDQPFSNHNGGDLAFGPDGYLYISSGDGGDSGDPGDRAQSLNTLLGKLLRIDVDNSSNGNNYAIPSNNPFVGNANALDEIWAYGLRNAWKFSFDRQTGDLWIADVGQGSFEEINNVSSSSSGLNFGWRCYEGNNTFNTSGCPNMSTLTFPVGVYAHSGTSRCSITGGYRYRGSQYPGFSGLYFFADYCSNEIGVLEQNGSNINMTFSTPFGGNRWVAFGEDVEGELYIAGISSSTVYKIKDASLSANEFEAHKISLFPNPTNEGFMISDQNNTSSFNVKVYDLNGRLLRNAVHNFYENPMFSVKDFNSGLYLVELIDEQGNKFRERLIKL